ncbi:MAG: hypothetical protein HQ518_29315 [Rhodopirellula sp.]|nr:hypothetical protein [Rhodopirellula sp.]
MKNTTIGRTTTIRTAVQLAEDMRACNELTISWMRSNWLPRRRRTGVASQDFFGTANGQSGDSFEVFQYGTGSDQLDDTLLLIQPESSTDYKATLGQSPMIDSPADADQPGTAGASVAGTSPADGTEPIGNTTAGMTMAPPKLLLIYRRRSMTRQRSMRRLRKCGSSR